MSTVTKKKGKPSGRKIALIIIGVLMVVILGIAVAARVFIARIDRTIGGQGTQNGVIDSGLKQESLPEYNGKDVLGILVCGIDYDVNTSDGESSYSNNEDRVGNTDLIMYVYYDIANNKVSVMQIMRDSFVGEELNTGGSYKINGLYAAAEDTSNRMNALAQAVYDQLKLPVDYYVAVDMDSLKDIVEAVDNIHVYIPVDISDPRTGDIIEAGWRWLEPEQVEFVVRNRYSPSYQGQSDFMRTQIQLNVLEAFFRLFKTMSPSDAAVWGQILINYIKTDMKAVDMLGLMQRALKIEADDITFVRPPYGGTTYKGMSVLVFEPEGTAELLNTYFRPEGSVVTAAQLGVKLIEYDPGNVYPASIRTMTDITSDAPPMPEGSTW